MLKSFGKSFILFLKIFLWWIIVFVMARLCFMLFHLDKTNDLSVVEWLSVFGAGFRHDLSVSSYFLLIPLALSGLFFFVPVRILLAFIHTYSLILLTVVSLLVTSDMALYSYWGFRLDASPLLYASHPKEMVASVSGWLIARQLLIGLVYWLFLFVIYRRYIIKKSSDIVKQGWISLPGFLIIMGLLVIPIRGGFGKATMNVGSVYFFNKQIANHSAVNVVFNLGYSLSHLHAQKNPYVVLENEKAIRLVEPWLNKISVAPSEMLKSKRPNILIILLESFTSKVIESLGGIPDVTPCFDSLAKDGVLFSNIYSSGSRSDRGLVAVLSGYPALPTQGIMLFPAKSQKLPFLSNELEQLDYNCSFFYGGDIDFGGMRAFLSSGGFSTIGSKSDYGKEAERTDWGVYDQYVFDSLSAYLSRINTPFFSVLFTLTSHEPYTIPVKPYRAGETIDDKFLNAIHYTDSCMGEFINKARQSPWWNNTLVIMLADHGSEHPGDDGIFNLSRYKIPMLWTGGAVKKDTVIATIASQADIPSTLLAQMGVDYSNFSFSRNILGLNENSGALFFFNDGFGFVNRQMSFAWDNKSKRVLNSTTDNPGPILDFARAYQQVLVDDFISR